MTEKADEKPRYIVSSAHLVSERAAELSEIEFGLIIAGNAFNRWVVRCMSAAGYPDLSALDVLTLHAVNHRARAKKLADLCLVLNVEDAHLVSYALKKLSKLELVAGRRRGKEMFFSTTETGSAACQDYRRIRESCLVGSVSALHIPGSDISEGADLLRALSGLYDQAARAAASL